MKSQLGHHCWRSRYQKHALDLPECTNFVHQGLRDPDKQKTCFQWYLSGCYPIILEKITGS